MRHFTLIMLAAAMASCGKETVGPEPRPPEVAAIAVSAPRGSILGVGTSAALIAQATAPDGSSVDADLLWRSSDESVARVDPDGLVTAVAPGRATISASAGDASGNAVVRVVDADIAGLGSLLDDPFAARLLDGMSAEVAAAWGDCETALATENLGEVEACIGDLRLTLEADAGPTPTEWSLVSLFTDWLERLLNLDE